MSVTSDCLHAVSQGKIWDCALPEPVWSGWAAALTGAYAE